MPAGPPHLDKSYFRSNQMFGVRNLIAAIAVHCITDPWWNQEEIARLERQSRHRAAAFTFLRYGHTSPPAVHPQQCAPAVVVSNRATFPGFDQVSRSPHKRIAQNHSFSAFHSLPPDRLNRLLAQAAYQPVAGRRLNSPQLRLRPFSVELWRDLLSFVLIVQPFHHVCRHSGVLFEYAPHYRVHHSQLRNDEHITRLRNELKPFVIRVAPAPHPALKQVLPINPLPLVKVA